MPILLGLIGAPGAYYRRRVRRPDGATGASRPVVADAAEAVRDATRS